MDATGVGLANALASVKKARLRDLTRGATFGGRCRWRRAAVAGGISASTLERGWLRIHSLAHEAKQRTTPHGIATQ